MSDQFFERPILNSPYEYPSRHWELDDNGQPTQQILAKRRGADFITPIPKPKVRKDGRKQESLDLSVFSAGDENYDHTAIINGVRQEVDKWRQLPEVQWRVTPGTARLLKH